MRRRFLLAAWLLAGAVLLGRSVELQVAGAAEWRAEADRQHRMQGEVAAARGGILDRDGVPLALSHESFRIGLAPHELADREEAAVVLARSLDLPLPETFRMTTSQRRWVTVPGRFPPRVREDLVGVRGVYVERELLRSYPREVLGRGLLGAVIDDEGAGGIEQAFDDHLRGTSGSEVMARDPEGRPIPGETWVVESPRSGGQVTLTLDVDLQEIGYEALQEAVERTGARGGDLLVTDPRTGEVLAMVALRDGEPSHAGVVSTPYEPGSTLKPFTVAALLRLERANMSDSVETGEGRWEVHGRTITDVTAGGRMTLARALQVSSNVGVARMAERLTPVEQYETLRDLGFGVPTGIALPGESGGTLRRPGDWSRQSPASLAIGYEISVTPMQMAMAYGALANGGVLMEPRIVRDLRDEEGRVVQTFEPRAVRRVIPEAVARELTRTLVGAVEDGTGAQARLSSFTVAGKSGTTRAYRVEGGYEPGGYHSSFVGFFPAQDPQLVVFVRLDRPQGIYYGGATAAPVTRATMEAILAARKPPLNRRALMAIARAQEAGSPSPVAPASGGPTGTGSAPALMPWLAARQEEAGAEAGAALPLRDQTELTLPDLRGVAPRVAARRLHSLGLVVVWEGVGDVQETRPAAGAPLLPGDTVRILSGLGSRPPPRVAGREGDE